jgi:hypothetical protein
MLYFTPEGVRMPALNGQITFSFRRRGGSWFLIGVSTTREIRDSLKNNGAIPRKGLSTNPQAAPRKAVLSLGGRSWLEESSATKLVITITI